MSYKDPVIQRTVRLYGFYQNDQHLGGYGGQTKMQRVIYAATPDGRILEQRASYISDPEKPYSIIKHTRDRAGRLHGWSSRTTKIKGLAVTIQDHYTHGHYDGTIPNDPVAHQTFDNDLNAANNRFNAYQAKAKRYNTLETYMSTMHHLLQRPGAKHSPLRTAYRRLAKRFRL